MSRTENVKKNSMLGLFNMVFTTCISFVTRTIFIKTLGAEYLGLNGLFSNVLGILSLADLGISNAITFSLYKPIAENDQTKITQLMRLLKKSYILIGLFMLLIGTAVSPFLDHIVNFDTDIDINYIVIYFLFLFNSASSYLFFSYNNLIIYADQKSYLTTKYEIIYSGIILLIQLIILVVLKNYYIYLVVPIVINIIKNYHISQKAKKLYPYIKLRPKAKLEKSETKKLIKNIYSLSLFKVSSIVYTSTDNIIISYFISTTLVGYYSNYLMIINVIKSLVNIVFSSMTASIGNLNSIASISTDYKFSVFKKLNMINFIVYGYCFTCLFNLLNPFIEIWIGREYLFEKTTVLLITLAFLIPGLNNIINIYKDACGLFWETRFRTLATAIVNIVSSIIFVKFWDINGIFLGTILAYLVTIYIVDPITVFKKVLKKNVVKYYIELLSYIIVIFVVNFIINIITNNFGAIFRGNIFNVIIELVMITLIYVIIISIIYCKNKCFKDVLMILRDQILKIKKS